jgi:uncharacterized protein
MVGVFGLSGIASGFLAGLFGIGGGLIMVPVLVYAFKTTGMEADHIVTMALGTSMAAIVFSSAQSAYGHYCKGSASIDCIRRSAPWVVAGVVIGGAIAARTPAHPLLIFVGVFQFFAAFLMVTDVSKLVTLQSLARGGLALAFFALVFGGIAAMVEDRYWTVIAEGALMGLANLLLRSLRPNIENRTVAIRHHQ